MSSLSGRGLGVAQAGATSLGPRQPAICPASASVHVSAIRGSVSVAQARSIDRRAVAAAPRAAGRRTFAERAPAPRDRSPSDRAPPPPLPKIDRASADALLQLPFRERLAVVKGLREQAAQREVLKRGRAARAAEGSRRAVRGPLRLAGGAYAGTRLWTPDDPATRPMMAKVRAAIFDALTARGCFDVAGRAVAEAMLAWGGEVKDQPRRANGGERMGENEGGSADEGARVEVESGAGSGLSAYLSSALVASGCGLGNDASGGPPVIFPPPPFPPGPPSWLDLFAGTGAVGLEALSRGFSRVTAVEMDPWVSRRCLEANARLCGRSADVAVASETAEGFLRRAAKTRMAPFDGISVCPPYDKVSYPELFELLEGSGLAHSQSYIVVEYPKRKRAQVPERLGGLDRIFDRKYGRTLVAIFGPTGGRAS